MTVKQIIQAKKFGQSTDKKPSGTISDSATRIFHENDTGKNYSILKSGVWQFDSESTRREIGHHQTFAGSHLSLYGDEVANIQKGNVFLFEENLQDKYDATTKFSANSPLYIKYGIHPFAGYNSLYLYAANNNVNYSASMLFGSDSFIIGGWFRPITSGGIAQTLFSYGSLLSGKNVIVYFSGNNNIIAKITDGTNTHTITVPASHLRDEKWHNVILIYNKEKKKMALIVTDGKNVIDIYEEADLTNAFSDLDFRKGKLCIGCYFDGTNYQQPFLGNVSNFHIYPMVNFDYNILSLLISGIREFPTKTNSVSVSFAANSINNQYLRLDCRVGHYVNISAELDEGIYDIALMGFYNSADGGSYNVYLDNGLVGTDNQKTANNTNILKIINSQFLTKGRHILKIECISAGKIRFAHIKFIKKDGTVTNGSSQFTLQGDELKKHNNIFSIKSVATLPFGAAFGTHSLATKKIGDYHQGIFYSAQGAFSIQLESSAGKAYGIYNIIIDGQKIDTIDGYSTKIILRKYNLALQSGAHTIRFEIIGKNSNSNGYELNICAVRGIMTEGICDDGITEVFSIDRDIADAIPHNRLSSSAVRFGNYLKLTPTYQMKVRRWFAGGLYKYLVRTSGGTSGKLDVLVNNKKIISSSVINGDTKHEGYVTVKRGYHFVEAHNISTAITDYLDLTCIRFTPVAKLTVPDNHIREKNHANTIPILTYKIQSGFSLKAYQMYIDRARFSEFVIKISGKAKSGTNGALTLKINNITTGIKQIGTVQKSGTANTITKTVAAITPLTDDIIPSATLTSFVTEIHVYFSPDNNDRKNLHGEIHTSAAGVAGGVFNFDIVSASDIDVIKNITLLLNANASLAIGSTLEIYGVLR